MVNQELFENKVQQSVDMLKARSRISRLLIGLSGGKDSLCLCELVKMAEITNVSYFNMEFMPDLQIQKDILDYACKRFNIPYEQIIKVPSEHYVKCRRGCFFTWQNERALEDFPKCSRADVYKSIAKEHKGTIVTGVKKADSIMMQRKINSNSSMELYPLKEWTVEEVFTFMKLRKIDIPKLSKKGCRGVGLADENITFIYEYYPEDYEKISKEFPFVGASVYKYKYFDIHKSMRIV